MFMGTQKLRAHRFSFVSSRKNKTKNVKGNAASIDTFMEAEILAIKTEYNFE